jgi:hypothetical protein
MLNIAGLPGDCVAVSGTGDGVLVEPGVVVGLGVIEGARNGVCVKVSVGVLVRKMVGSCNMTSGVGEKKTSLNLHAVNTSEKSMR